MKKSAHGFTLVELLVVISIIAILSTIGIVSFTRVQQIARDGKRVADIDTIAKSLETSKDFTTGIYYNKLLEDFPNGIPQDPRREITKYCLAGENSDILSINFSMFVAQGFNWPSNRICPGNAWSEVSDEFSRNGLPIESFKRWIICAKKESNNEVYCKQSLSQ